MNLNKLDLSNPIIRKDITKKIAQETNLTDHHCLKHVFKEKACSQLLLNILLKNKKLTVESSKTEYSLKNRGYRSVRLDIIAKDDKNNIYNVEVQNLTNGASPERARYYSSSIDVHNLPAKADFRALPTSYVIFITGDKWKKNLPLYPVERMVTNLGVPFEDRAHILYVNNNYVGNDDIGKLMNDFKCTKPEEMHFSVLADALRKFKGDDKSMGKTLELVRKISRNEGFEEGRQYGETQGEIRGKEVGAQESTLKDIRSLMETCNWTAQEAMKALKISFEDQKKYLMLL